MPTIDESPTMPHTDHTAKELAATLKSIIKCSLPIEVFDAFLAEYKKTGNLAAARHFAMCEWDC